MEEIAHSTRTSMLPSDLLRCLPPLSSLALVLSIALVGQSARADVTGFVAQVQQAELVAHVEALAFDRSSPAGQAAAAAYITGELESYGYTVTTQTVGASANLIATVDGSDAPGDVFVLGAHFDTVPGSPGADDDASGVAAVLETARILAGVDLARSLHLVLFALEESGYQGSEAYAGALAGAGVDVTGMISLDMIGYTCSTPGCQIVLPSIPGCLESSVTSTVGDFIGLGANTASVPLMTDFLANAALHVPALSIEHFVIQGTGTCLSQSRRSDHKSFWDEGYPAIILGDGAEARNPNYHQSSDTPDTLDPDFLTSVTRGVVAHVATSRLDPAAPVVPALPPLALAALAVVIAAAGALLLALHPSAREVRG